jgi:hypothetical protein
MADVFDVADGFGPIPKTKMVDLVCKSRTVRVELNISLKQTHDEHGRAGASTVGVATEVGGGGGVGGIGSPMVTPTAGMSSPTSNTGGGASGGGSAAAANGAGANARRSTTTTTPTTTTGVLPTSIDTDDGEQYKSVALDAIESLAGGTALDARLIGAVFCIFLVLIYCAGRIVHFYGRPSLGIVLASVIAWGYYQMSGERSEAPLPPVPVPRAVRVFPTEIHTRGCHCGSRLCSS